MTKWVVVMAMGKGSGEVPGRGRRGLCATFARRSCLVVLLAAACALAATALAPPAKAHTVARGLFDPFLLSAAPEKRTTILYEMSRQLHAQVIRLNLSWPSVEPQRGVYNEALLADLGLVLDEARARGLQVEILVFNVPRWASDSRFWDNPPDESIPKGYQTYYPMRQDALPDFQALAQMLAMRFKDKVKYWACWCEPNLWLYFYPQTRPGDEQFSARWYVAMLRRFYKGVKAGDPAALVLGGETSPFGQDDRWWTSPQRFAARLYKRGAGKYMDGYAHHPYAVEGWPAPGVRPTFPNMQVSLGNITTLMNAFPREPIYIDEYGYPTRETNQFGLLYVSEIKQKQSLVQAYRLVHKYPRIKMLMWYMRQDYSPSDKATDPNGTYFGLRRVNGRKKPAWHAFSRLK